MARTRGPISLLAVLVLGLCSLAFSACGSEDKLDIIEGEPVEIGELEYNVLFTRYLNPDDVEDGAYLEAQPPADPNSLYLGVFIQVENLNEDEKALLPTNLTVSDTDENTYNALFTESPYALELGTTVDGGGEIPEPDSVAAEGPIEGSLVLFQIPDEAAEKRPLKLVIPGLDGPAELELDI